MPEAQVIGKEAEGIRMRNVENNQGHESMEPLPFPEEEYETLEEFKPEHRMSINSLVIISIIDVLVSTGFIISCWSFAYAENGVSLLCMGFQGLAHLMTSLLLFGRFRKESFFGKKDSAYSNLIYRRNDLKREQKYFTLIGITLLLTCVGLLVKAARKFRFWDHWEQDHVDVDTRIAKMTEEVAWTVGVWYFLMFIYRFYMRRHLNMRILHHAYFVSFVGFVFGIVMAIAASFLTEGTWKADAIAAAALAVLVFIDGFYTIYHHLDDVDDLLKSHKAP